MKKETKTNFTKLTQKKGISLIVLIVTIIVIIILAAAVILTLSKNNPIESAREATFKEDVRAFQDELALSISKEYTEKQGQRDEKITASDFDTIKKYIPSFTEKYEGKFVIENDKLVGTDKLSEKEIKWAQDLSVVESSKAPFNPQVWDETATSEDCFYWDGTTITGVIPEKLSGVTKVRIPTSCTAIRSDYAFGGTEDYRNFVTGITTVEIPETVTEIGNYAFHNFKKLTSINIPDTVISIGDLAFDRCNSLKNITLPNGVTNIGNSAFYECNSLESIIIPDSVTSIGSNVFINTAYYNNSDNWENGVLYINNHLIDSKEYISGEYIIKPGTKTLAPNAFDNCSSLATITIPESVTSIGNGAFEDCSSLESITIPESVTSIGDYAFKECSNLTSITIPEGVTSIGQSTFNECGKLRTINIPNNLVSIGTRAFYECNSLESITIPESVTSIGEEIFSECTSLENITVNEKNTVYDSRNNCNAIINTSTNELIFGCKNTVIPEGVKSIGNYAFSACSNLTGITIPEGVTSIGSGAFWGCGGLERITLPTSVTSIGGSTFSCCYILVDITIPEGVTSIGESAFLRCNKLTINCRVESKPFGWDSNWNPDNRPVNWGYTVE